MRYQVKTCRGRLLPKYARMGEHRPPWCPLPVTVEVAK